MTPPDPAAVLAVEPATVKDEITGVLFVSLGDYEELRDALSQQTERAEALERMYEEQTGDSKADIEAIMRDYMAVALQAQPEDAKENT